MLSSWVLHLLMSAIVTKSPAHPPSMSCHCSLPDPQLAQLQPTGTLASLASLASLAPRPLPSLVPSCVPSCPPCSRCLACSGHHLLSLGLSHLTNCRLSWLWGKCAHVLHQRDPSAPLFVDQPGCRRGAKHLALSKPRALIKALQ